MTTTIEPDLFRGYEPRSHATATDVGQVVLDRIHELIGYRRWYRSHVGWLVDSHREDVTELRLLLGLRRRARRQAPDPIDQIQGLDGIGAGVGAAMTRVDPELGTEKLCARCQEWWPLDDEFYYLSNPAYCKACWVEYHRLAKPRTEGFRLVGTRAYAR